MTVVRRRTPANTSGYGVYGSNYTAWQEELKVNLFDLVTEIGLGFTVESVTGNLVPAYASIYRVIWEARMVALVYNPNKSDTYNVPSGKTKLGRWLISKGRFISAQGFHSYDADISCKGTFTYKIIDDALDEDIPCDEPAVTLPGPPIVADNLPVVLRYTGTQALFESFSTLGDIVGGDSFSYYPEIYMQSYVVGISFVYTGSHFTEGQWNQTLDPPIILL